MTRRLVRLPIRVPRQREHEDQAAELPAGLAPGTAACLDCPGAGTPEQGAAHSRATGHIVISRPVTERTTR